MADVLLTGATGFLGRALARALVDRGDRVSAVGRGGTPHPAITWVRHDLTARRLPALPDEVDTVVHLAQSRRYRDFPDAARDIFSVNVASTVQLLDWARTIAASRFVLASSGGVYGRGPRPFTEDAPLAPAGTLDFYLETKRAAELLATEYAPFMDVVVLRPFFLYGSGQRDMLVPRLVRSVATGDAVRLDGPNGLRMNPVHVSDAVRAVVAALDVEATTRVNVAGPEVLHLREMCEVIGRHVGRRPVFDVTDGAAGDLIGDTARMSRVLAAPSTAFEDGVRELCSEVARDAS